MALLLSSPSPADRRGITKGMSSGNRAGLFLSRFAPWMVRWMIRNGAAVFERDPERYLDAVAAQMAAPDRELLKNEDFRNSILRDFQEAYRQGAEGHVVDGQLALTSRSWGFHLSSIQVPVLLWQGTDDTLVTTNMAEYLTQQLPRSTCYFVSGAGHMLTEHADVLKQIRAALHCKHS